jgi:hypothetical protein
VSVWLKGASQSRQMSSAESNGSEPLMKGRKGKDDVKTGL